MKFVTVAANAGCAMAGYVAMMLLHPASASTFVPPSRPRPSASPPRAAAARSLRMCTSLPTDVLLKVNLDGLDEDEMVSFLMSRG